MKKNFGLICILLSLNTMAFADNYSLFDYYEEKPKTWIGFAYDFNEVGKLHLGVEDLVGRVDLRLGAGYSLAIADMNDSNHLLVADMKALIELVDTRYLDFYLGGGVDIKALYNRDAKKDRTKDVDVAGNLLIGLELKPFRNIGLFVENKFSRVDLENPEVNLSAGLNVRF